MKILSIDLENSIHQIEYLRIPLGMHHAMPAVLDLIPAKSDYLPRDIDALVITSDLQGREKDSSAGDGSKRLLGEILAEELKVLQELGCLPQPDKLAVILCGDLYTSPNLDRRRGSGDCRPVWLALKEISCWVCGVAGNHDLFSDKPSKPDADAFLKTPGIHFLDGGTVSLNGLLIGGISGVVGNPLRPFRRTEQEFLGAISMLVSKEVDLLLMHDGPDYPESAFKGNPAVRSLLANHRPVLTIRGHAFWPQPLIRQPNGGQVLNVDSRAVIVTAN